MSLTTRLRGFFALRREELHSPKTSKTSTRESWSFREHRFARTRSKRGQKYNPNLERQV
ncbi:MAG: hypothetical protein AABY16_03090 [Nanoarchaeota archaeon]